MDRYTFNGASFSFLNAHNGTDGAPDSRPAINAHLIHFAHTTFNGCVFAANPTQDGLPAVPIHFINGGQGEHASAGILSFVGCNLGGKSDGVPPTPPGMPRPPPNPDLGPEFWVSGRSERVSYTNCRVQDVLFTAGQKDQKTILFSDTQAVDSLHDTRNVIYLMQETVPGSLYYSFNGISRDELEDEYKRKTYGPFLRWVAGSYPYIPVWIDSKTPRMPVANFKINKQTRVVDGRMVAVPDGTATLEGVEAGTLQVGDVITAEEEFEGMLLHDPARDSRLNGPLLLGRVSKVEPAGDKETATLIHVPIGLRGGLKEERTLRLAYFPRIHPPTTGLVRGTAMAKNVIENVKTRPRFKKDPMDMMDFPIVAQEISWGVGHRIFGNGIPPGAYIRSIEFGAVVMRITLSKNFLFNAGDTALFDADVRGIETPIGP